MTPSNSAAPFPQVSVVIPVYNDADPLRKCLRALECQTYPREKFRVNVVDNASDEDIKSIVDDVECAHLLYESQRGSYAARNRGIRESEGEVIAFTDADCLPERTWIERGVRRLTEGSPCGLVGGRIAFTFRNGSNPLPPELYDRSHFLRQDEYVKEKNWAATANAFTRKDVFQNVGLFDGELQSGGDEEWGQRVAQYGYKVCHAQEACVKHPARDDYQSLREKKVRIVQGTVRAKKKRGYPVVELFTDVVKSFGHDVKFSLLEVWGREQYDWRTKISSTFMFALQGARASFGYFLNWIYR